MILALKEDATPPPNTEEDVRVCERSAAREQGDLASLSQDTGYLPSPASLFVCVCICVCLCNESVRLTEQEVRQTDMSLTQNILQTLGVQPPPLHLAV